MATPRAAQHRDLEQRLRNLEAALAAVRSALSRRPKFEVSSGDLTIDGGDVVMLDTDGSVMFRLGTQQYGDRGLSLYRENGSAVLEVKRNGSDPLLQQAWTMRDGSGNVLVGEWAFGTGMARPRIPMPVMPCKAPAGYGADGPYVTTTSGTFERLYRADTNRQNPLYQPAIVVTTDAGTTAEVEVVNGTTGTRLTNFFGGAAWVGTVAAGSTSVQLAPTLNVPGAHDSRVKLDVRARRTGGAGNVSVSVPYSMGG